jgi:hypothetical protein
LPGADGDQDDFDQFDQDFDQDSVRPNQWVTENRVNPSIPAIALQPEERLA